MNKITFGDQSTGQGWLITFEDKSALRIKGFWHQDMLEEIKKSNCTSLDFDYWEEKDFSVAKDFAHQFTTLSVGTYGKSYNGLENFSHVRSLTLHLPLNNKSFDLMKFQNLEYLNLLWVKNNNYPTNGYPQDIYNLPQLNEIYFTDFNGDFLELQQDTKLENIRVWGNNVPTLDGLERAKKLKSLWLEDIKGLANISAIKSLDSLINLKIFNCPDLQDYSPIHRLTNLVKIGIGGDKIKKLPIEKNIDWIDDFEKLETLTYGVVVEKVDWSKVISKKSLNSVFLITSIDAALKPAVLEKIAQENGREIYDIRQAKSKGLVKTIFMMKAT